MYTILPICTPKGRKLGLAEIVEEEGKYEGEVRAKGDVGGWAPSRNRRWQKPGQWEGGGGQGRADSLHKPLAQSSTGRTETSILILRTSEMFNLPSLPPHPPEYCLIR